MTVRANLTACTSSQETAALPSPRKSPSLPMRRRVQEAACIGRPPEAFRSPSRRASRRSVRIPIAASIFWAYTVEIVNLGAETVQLKSRHWLITDALGRVQEVRGAGVVGEQPILPPGAHFEYTSGVPLPTSTGIMEGSYSLVTEGGEIFSAEVPAFSLDLPDATRTLN